MSQDGSVNAAVSDQQQMLPVHVEQKFQKSAVPDPRASQTSRLPGSTCRARCRRKRRGEKPTRRPRRGYRLIGLARISRKSGHSSTRRGRPAITRWAARSGPDRWPRHDRAGLRPQCHDPQLHLNGLRQRHRTQAIACLRHEVTHITMTQQIKCTAIVRLHLAVDSICVSYTMVIRYT